VGDKVGKNVFLLEMNSFVVSARKYRPATFDTVVGQAHITNTLKNAIRTKHLAQAFLFCGPRGVGKTTCARILAKTLNCKHLTDDQEACNRCESCMSFNNGQSLNIYELDAASNNSVDDIRNLVEQVRYAPHAGEYKIYIIDEVHMLSASAFNAFLKTLEEPPSYAIFILATTEKHKILPTILSRCQIFDFNRIQVEDIAHHLQFVASGEGVTAEEDALHIIAQKADGALRDALSIFDQIVSFAGTTVTYKDVINNLSILDYDYYFKVTDEIRNGNIPAVLVAFNELLADGFDGHHFITGLAAHFRDLLVSKDEVTLPLLEVSKGTRERYKVQAAMLSQAMLLKFISICVQADLDYRSAKNQRLHVELTLMKMCAMSVHPSGETSGQVNAQTTAVPGKPEAADKPVSVPAAKASVSETTDSKSTPVNTPANTAPVKPVENSAAVPPPSHAVQGSSAQVKENTATPSATPSMGGILKGASLANLRKPEVPKEEKPVTKVNTELESLPVDREMLERCWMDYAEKMKEAGKLQLHTTLTMKMPVLTDGVIIELTIHNPSQDEVIAEEKADLLDYLRTNLRNYNLQLKTILDTSTSDPELVYTSKEKYKKMVEKNPGLDDFRRQLGLELEL
jgi:DNA polymerase-3 subunit gamma/tau